MKQSLARLVRGILCPNVLLIDGDMKLTLQRTNTDTTYMKQQIKTEDICMNSYLKVLCVAQDIKSKTASSRHSRMKMVQKYNQANYIFINKIICKQCREQHDI